MAGGPLRIDSRPSRWSVTRETERESRGKSWRGTDILSLFPRQRLRIGLPRISGKEEDKRRLGEGEWRKGARRGGVKKGGRKMEGGKEEAVAVGIS